MRTTASGTRRHSNKVCPGFTLLELLVVIAIIAVLAGMLMAGVTMVRKQATKIACMNNLRMIGVAISGYLGEWENLLPGPTGYGQKYTYTSSSMNLPMYLAGFLDAEEPSAVSKPMKGFMCREYLARKGTLSYMSFNGDPTRGAAGTQKRWSPFGVHVAVGSIWNRDPFNYNELRSASTLWALKEVDKTNVNPATGWWPELPAGPVHGMYRTTLYFDFRADLLLASSDVGVY